MSAMLSSNDLVSIEFSNDLVRCNLTSTFAVCSFSLMHNNSAEKIDDALN